MSIEENGDKKQTKPKTDFNVLQRKSDKEQQAKYKKLYNKRKVGGIFVEHTRSQLLGIHLKPKEGKGKSSFWYHIRKQIKNGLIDLELFAEQAEEEDVNGVLTRERVEPIIEAFFTYSNLKPQNLYDIANKANVAQMLIERSLNYLIEESKPYQRENDKQDIENIIKLSKTLSTFLENESKRSPKAKKVLHEQKAFTSERIRF